MGVVISIGIVLGAILHTTTNFALFWELTGFLIVVGLTFTTTLMAYELRYVMIALKLMVKIVYAPRFNRGILKAEIGRIIKWAYVLQKSGIPALEAEIKKINRVDSFLKFGTDILLGGYTGDEMRQILHNMADSSYHRNVVPAEILKSMSANAPTFGMFATVLGLIMMLDNMGTDPTALGPSMAVAMAGTLYGVGLARLILLPAAVKIQQREEIVRFRNHLVAEGLALLADRKSPRHIQDKMNSFLDPSIHFSIDKMIKS
jgi:chemotaxis protein MotA